MLLLFSIFVGAAAMWTTQTLQQLQATPAEAKAAFMVYRRLAISIVDSTAKPLTPSVTALAAIGNLNNIMTHAHGMLDSTMVLRMRWYGMARSLQVDSLDTVKNREGRRRNGCNMIDIEVQRRVWWNMVSGDWFVTSPQAEWRCTCLETFR